MTQHGGNPQEFQDHRQGRRPVTTKFDGMWHFLSAAVRENDDVTGGPLFPPPIRAPGIGPPLGEEVEDSQAPRNRGKRGRQGG